MAISVRKIGFPRSWFFAVLGLASLIWFLIRVIPKPSRAGYPCQRAAMPMASAFVLWLVNAAAAVALWRRGAGLWRRARVGWACLCFGIAVLAGSFFLMTGPDAPALADPQVPNNPVGTAHGLKPGRVVWIFDPDATSWIGPGYGHWWESGQTDQAVVEQMMSKAVRYLSGKPTVATAWDALVRHFNVTHGKGDVGYAPGEKICIKVNFVGCHRMSGWGGVNHSSYDLVDRMDYMNTSPQMIVALLRHLVDEVGVAQQDITVGDPMALFPNQYYDICLAEFSDVRYWDYEGGVPGHPRTAAQYSTVPFHWSCHPAGAQTDYVPVSYVEAAYIIDMANLKSHASSGVTLCAKNHYGSLIRLPVADGYYDMHLNLPKYHAATSSYRPLVDLLGHAHLGGKTLLYLVDGLYAGVHHNDQAPIKWDFTPFDGDWTSSLFVSQDPLAIESVCFDLLQHEGDPRAYPQIAGADDFLTEAAQADAPPSGTFYDPDHVGDVARLASLGVHEHWNNATDMKYSRNLGSGDGIELIKAWAVAAVAGGTPGRKVLSYNYPNPFNPRTTIAFVLPEQSRVSLSLFDAAGRSVATLLDGDLPAGMHEQVWDGLDARGRPVASGVYYYRLQMGDHLETSRMLLAR